MKRSSQKTRIEKVKLAELTAGSLLAFIRDAHSASCTQQTQLLQDALFDLIKPAAKLQYRLIRISQSIQ